MKKEKLNQNEKKWIGDLKRLLNRKPKNIEVVIDDCTIYIYPVGTLSKHIGSIYDYGGIGTGQDENEELLSFPNKGKLLSYPEGQ